MIGTAKLNGIDPLAFLTDVLERLVSGSTKSTNLSNCSPGTGDLPVRSMRSLGRRGVAHPPRRQAMMRCHRIGRPDRNSLVRRVGC
jgi:hypothetical protein